MKKIAIAVLAGTTVLFTGAAYAQGVDFSKVEIGTIDLGNKTYMLTGQGGNITVAVGTDGIIMVDAQFAPLHDKIKAAITKISPLPIKYVINTHYHGDHVEGNDQFQKEGAVIVAHDNLRVRLAAGTTNMLNGNKTPPAPAARIPTMTYQVGDMKVQVGGRVAELKHVINAHTDGDTWVYFPDANVLALGDTFTRNYPNIDWGNGGNIAGMVAAADRYLKAANDNTKIVPGHGALATKANLQEFRDMLATVRDRLQKLLDEGKTEQEVLALDPLKDLNAKWAGAAGLSTGPIFLRNAFNSLRNRN
ncbi:MAG TPA: MBL fold metallo-hydrolase [Xanthobacteraceae bacterium]|nr:MBL fold metallo-hydrolase [Xanthobacteraceae bacterium]